MNENEKDEQNKCTLLFDCVEKKEKNEEIHLELIDLQISIRNQLFTMHVYLITIIIIACLTKETINFFLLYSNGFS